MGNPDAGDDAGDDAGSDAGGDAGSTDAGSDAGSAAALKLTVHNYISWCFVSINGGAYKIDDPQVIDVDAGDVVHLAATPRPTFELGISPWHLTDGDHGSGDPGTPDAGELDTTITIGSASKCVWVCCENQGTTDCPTTTQCP